MTTTPENGGAEAPRDHDRTDGERSGPDFAPAAATEDTGPRPDDHEGAAQDPAADPEADADQGLEHEEYEQPGAPRRFSGILTAEAFGIASVLALLASFAGTRVVEVVASVTASSQEGVLKALALGDGVPALLAAVLAAGALSATSPATRPWARWLSGGVLIVAVLAIAGAVGAYFMVPPPAPMPPMVPGN